MNYSNSKREGGIHMPSNTELRTYQNNQLFDLLKLKKENTHVIGLDVLILKLQSGMTQEDVAYVEKLIDELFSKK